PLDAVRRAVSGRELAADRDVRRDRQQREACLKEDPRALAIRTDDPRVGAADNRAQVESDPEPEVGPAGHGRGHSNPRPTMLMKTSSRVGSVLRRAWTLAP